MRATKPLIAISVRRGNWLEQKRRGPRHVCDPRCSAFVFSLVVQLSAFGLMKADFWGKPQGVPGKFACGCNGQIPRIVYRLPSSCASDECLSLLAAFCSSECKLRSRPIRCCSLTHRKRSADTRPSALQTRAWPAVAVEIRI